MNCPFCNAENDNDNLFCVSCGKNFALVNSGASTQPSPTQYYNVNQLNQTENSPESVQTAFPPAQHFNQPSQNFNPSIPYVPAAPKQKSSVKFVLLGAAALLLLIGGAIGAFFLLNKPTATAEALPDHLGMFVQNKEKNNLAELSKYDSANAVQAKEELLKNETLPAVEDKPNFILYSDGKDIPLGDLKLVQLDSIKDDGTVKQINFQAAPIEGKSEIKKLRVPDGLANGKYAFALFVGFLDEGKHKFWAFEVKNAQKNDNGDLAKAFSLSMKPKQTAPASNSNSDSTNTTIVKAPPTPKPEPIAPAGSRVAYCNSSNVVMRGSPSLTAKKVSALRRGQKIYVINYSDNYDYWNGMEGNWAYVQTESGSRGWVFTPLIGY